MKNNKINLLEKIKNIRTTNSYSKDWWKFLDKMIKDVESNIENTEEIQYLLSMEND